MNAPCAPGRVTTFYSYKGGTGRSMLLANVAWLLASVGERVLVMDWDLEAPGLHRYFKPFLPDPDLRATPGVVQWLYDYWDAVIDSDSLDIDALVRNYADPRRYAIPLQTEAFLPKGGGIDFIGAGRQDGAYSSLVENFDFARLYSELQGADFIAASKAILAGPEGYDHVLVDSRTGISDSAGICTVGLADTLLACFTYNNQSVCGAAQVARSARAQQEALRAHAARAGRTMPPFEIFGIPSRVDSLDPDRLLQRRNFARHALEDVVTPIESGQAQKFWIEAEVPHHPLYAYEEALAVCMEKIEDQRGVLGAAQRVARLLCAGEARPFPGLTDAQQRAMRIAFERNDVACFRPAVATAWERIAPRFGGEADRRSLAEEAMPVLMQLYAVPAGNREPDSPCQRKSVREMDLSHEERRIVGRLLGMGIVTPVVSEGGERAYTVADDSILEHWTEFRELFRRNHDVLVVRDELLRVRQSWESGGPRLISFLEVARNVPDMHALGSRESWIGKRNQDFLHGLLEAREVNRKVESLQRQEEYLKARVEAVRGNGNEIYVRTRNVGVIAFVIAGAVAVASTWLYHERGKELVDLRTRLSDAQRVRALDRQGSDILDVLRKYQAAVQAQRGGVEPEPGTPAASSGAQIRGHAPRAASAGAD